MHQYPTTYEFMQSNLLRGMTSSLRNGACWGLCIKWLEECVSKGPVGASLSLFYGTSALEAVIKHHTCASCFLPDQSDEFNIWNTTLALSRGRFMTELHPNIYYPSHLHSAVSIIAQMSNKENYYGLLILTMNGGRHAITVTKKNDFWTIFDPNYGSWIISSLNGGPSIYSQWLMMIFSNYEISDVKLHKVIVQY